MDGKSNNLLTSYKEMIVRWRKWITGSLCISALGLAIVSHTVLNWVETQTRKNSINALNAVLTSTHYSLRHVWLESLYNFSEQWAQHKNTIEAIQALASLSNKNSTSLSNHPKQAVLQGILTFRSSSKPFQLPEIIGRDGTVWSSTDPTRIGAQNNATTQLSETWSKAIRGESQITPPIKSSIPLKNSQTGTLGEYPTMYLWIPVVDSSDDVMAVMSYSIDPYDAFIPMTQEGRIGKTGETYALDKSGTIVSPSRFAEEVNRLGLLPPDKPILLNLQVRVPEQDLETGKPISFQQESWQLTKAARSATDGKAGSHMDGILDYRGIRVLSTWIWDDHFKMGFVTEIDEHEALSPYYQIRLAILLLIGTILVLMAMAILVIEQFAGKTLRNQVALKAIKLASASEEKFQSIFENVVEGIISIDHHGTILDFNHAAERIFGYAASEVTGKNVRMLMPQPDQGRHDQYLQKYEQTGERHIMGGYREVTALHKDGSTFDMELSLGEFKEGDKPYFVGLVRDISERKETERLLIKAREKAEAANQEKSQFLSRVSHELRTPLNAILGFSQLLEMEDRSEKSKKKISRILNAARHLKTMINEVMNISSIDQHKKNIPIDPLDLKQIFQEVTEVIRPQAKQKKIHFTVEDIPATCQSVWANHKFLKQSLLKILSNGIKYNRPEGTLKLSVERSSNNHVQLKVTDTGIGIPEDKMDRLFSPFDRLDREKENAEIEGTGLGLALTKKLIDSMQGTLSVSSNQGQGTEFTIELERVS